MNALTKIEQIGDDHERADLMLKYASILLKNSTEATLKALRNKKFNKIKISSLIPALHGIPRQSIDFAKKYLLDYAINLRKSTDKSVHNMVFYLLVHGQNGQELIEYLKN